MTVIDLTHIITEEMPVYPGTAQPSLVPAATIGRDHYRETQLCIWSHVGTHMDAPAHLLADGKTLDTYDAAVFCGKAAVIDCRGLARDAKIPASCLDGIPEDIEIVLLNTGHAQNWGTDAYFGTYPTPDEDFCRELARHGVHGLGIDAMSVDPIGNQLPNHRLLFAEGLYIIENLCNLEQISKDTCMVCALPLKWKDADGAPARVVAML